MLCLPQAPASMREKKQHQHQVLQALLRLLCGDGSIPCALVLHQPLQLQRQVLLEERVPAAVANHPAPAFLQERQQICCVQPNRMDTLIPCTCREGVTRLPFAVCASCWRPLAILASSPANACTVPSSHCHLWRCDRGHSRFDAIDADAALWRPHQHAAQDVLAVR
jgi:hypothetical protein